jgi:CBS domain-containing protein
MFSMSIRAVMGRKPLVVAPATTVSAAAREMSRRRTGAILVVDDRRLVGIFTERDALFRVIAPGRDPSTTEIADVMTPTPATVAPDKSFGYALLVMQEGGFRHLPVLEAGQVIGLVSARNALDPELEEFTFESQRRAQFLKEGA